MHMNACVWKYHPGFAETLQEQAQEDSRIHYEASVEREVRVELLWSSIRETQEGIWTRGRRCGLKFRTARQEAGSTPLTAARTARLDQRAATRAQRRAEATEMTYCPLIALSEVRKNLSNHLKSYLSWGIQSGAIVQEGIAEMRRV